MLLPREYTKSGSAIRRGSTRPANKFSARRRRAGMAAPVKHCRFNLLFASSFVLVSFFSSSPFSCLLILVLLLISGVHPNPGPRRPPPSVANCILCWNCDGIGNSTAELRHFLGRHNVLVACVQESKLTARSKSPSFPDYTVVRRDWPGDAEGGGLLTLVHHSVQFHEA